LLLLSGFRLFYAYELVEDDVGEETIAQTSTAKQPGPLRTKWPVSMAPLPPVKWIAPLSVALLVRLRGATAAALTIGMFNSEFATMNFCQLDSRVFLSESNKKQ